MFARSTALVAVVLAGTFARAGAAAASAGGDIDDTGTTLQLQLLSAALVIAGLALAAVTVWFWRSTKPDPPQLAPLQVMSDRRFRKAGHDDRAGLIQAARPGAVSPAEAADQHAPVDLAALAAERSLPSFDDHAGFGDLVDIAVASDGSMEGGYRPAQWSHDGAPVPWTAPEPSGADLGSSIGVGIGGSQPSDLALSPGDTGIGTSPPEASLPWAPPVMRGTD